jgi:hypothetical protein
MIQSIVILYSGVNNYFSKYPNFFFWNPRQTFSDLLRKLAGAFVAKRKAREAGL